MVRMNLGSAIHITGTKETITAAGNMRRVPQKALRQVALERARVTEARLKSEMDSEYRSAWATGHIARSIKTKITNTPDGVSAQISGDSGARDHLQYITALVPGGFNTFPVTPFKITPVVGKFLYIRPPGHARNFIRNKETGKLAGARSSRIRKKEVLWGRQTGGFKRDVIAEVVQSEGEIFVQDVQAAFAASLESIVMHPKKARSFIQDPTTGRLMGSRKS